MISNRVLRSLARYLRVTSRVFFSIPFEVTGCRDKFKLRMCTDATSAILFTLNFSLQFEAMSYSFLRLCQMYLTGSYAGIHHYVIHCFNLVGFGYPVYLQLFLVVYGQQFCDFFNQASAYDSHLRSKASAHYVNFLLHAIIF